jgi:hypothetical protein
VRAPGALRRGHRLLTPTGLIRRRENAACVSLAMRAMCHARCATRVLMPKASQSVAGGGAQRHHRKSPPRAAPRQGVPEATLGTNPLPPLCGITRFLDHVPVVSLRSTTSYFLCPLRVLWEQILCHPSAGWCVFWTAVRWCRCARPPAIFFLPSGNNLRRAPVQSDIWVSLPLAPFQTSPRRAPSGKAPPGSSIFDA